MKVDLLDLQACALAFVRKWAVPAAIAVLVTYILFKLIVDLISSLGVPSITVPFTERTRGGHAAACCSSADRPLLADEAADVLEGPVQPTVVASGTIPCFDPATGQYLGHAPAFTPAQVRSLMLHIPPHTKLTDRMLYSQVLETVAKAKVAAKVRVWCCSCSPRFPISSPRQCRSGKRRPFRTGASSCESSLSTSSKTRRSSASNNPALCRARSQSWRTLLAGRH
jgi:hypothetical protein